MKMKNMLLCLVLVAAGCVKQPDVSRAERSVVVATNPGPIIVVSDRTPDPYTHPTTHPAAQFEELGLDPEMGHGDGGTTVAFVGKVVHVTEAGDIQPIAGVRFYSLNDSMLLREVRRDLLPFTTDTNGNFQATVDIFAASGCRKGSFQWHADVPADVKQKSRRTSEEKHKDFMKKFEKADREGEWVVYQTGTSTLGVEADGFEPRRVNVRYQQPSTMIVLNRKK
jgi:hypothetical protein